MSEIDSKWVSSKKTPYLKSMVAPAQSNQLEYMFIEDYTAGFSYNFVNLNRDFYITNPKDCELKRLLEHGKYNFFDYEFQEVIMSIFRHMLLKGKAYVEIVEIKENGKLVGLNFILVSAKKSFQTGKRTFFIGIGQDEKKVFFSVPRRHIIEFDIKSLGLKRNYYTSKRKKMKSLDITRYTNLLIDPQMKYLFDFSFVAQKIDIQKIKIFKEIGWIARDSGNSFLSEMYMLYQKAKFLDFMWNSMEYIIGVINAGIESFLGNKEIGKIVVDIKKKDYFAKFAECCDEKISIHELSKFLYERK